MSSKKLRSGGQGFALLFLEEQLQREVGGGGSSHGDFVGGQWDFKRLSELKTPFVDNKKRNHGIKRFTHSLLCMSACVYKQT